VADLSGGERRRLQMLRLLAAEPNVLLLDEPTNDLDTDTLASLEDLLDTWPGTLVVASHDRYLVERVTDTAYGLFGDGRLTHLPGGVDEYLARVAGAPGPIAALAPPSATTSGGDTRAARKELARLERLVGRLEQQEARLHEQLAANATDYARLSELGAQLKEVQAERARTEEAWLGLAESAPDA
jgi:ABC-type multidrug transport system ATPase subunit